jgi:hypothetical protein
MARHLALNQELLDRAFRVSGEPTKKAAVTRALQAFIARHALLGADQVFTTGLVLQQWLQGFAGPKNRAQLVERLSAQAFLQPVKERSPGSGGSPKFLPTSWRANRNDGRSSSSSASATI